MQKNLTNFFFSSMKRVRQDNDWYCAPAVLSMMADYFHETISQEDFVRAAKVEDTIRQHGMTLAELALAVSTRMPNYFFWYKRDATLGELSSLVTTCGYPVGVEWQGIFDDRNEPEDEEQNGDDDAGHYSVVTGISTAENWITLADPYHNMGIDRQLTILEFIRRWWDINETYNTQSKRWTQIDDYHALFVVLPNDDATPELFGMIHNE